MSHVSQWSSPIEVVPDCWHCSSAVIAYGGSKDIQTPFVFRSYICPEFQNNRRFDGDDESAAEIYKIARATSAAPLYFRHQEIGGKKFIDGGVRRNNPSELISSEIRAVHGKTPKLVLSIGTGLKTEGSNDDNGAGARRHKRFNNARDVLSTARKLPDFATDSEITHNSLETSLEIARNSGDKKYPMYFRFNVPNIASDVKLDQWNPSNDSQAPNGEKTLRCLKKATENYLLIPAVKKKLAECAKELVRVRRNRAVTERWERFATQTVYQCPESAECELPHFPSREKLRMHASEHHQFVPQVMMENRPVCLIDQCMETPQVHDSDDGFITHLKGPHHELKDARAMCTSELEAWLDDGRRTEDQILNQEEQDRLPSIGAVRRPSSATDPRGKKGLKSLFFGRKRRSVSLQNEDRISTSDSQ